LGFGDALDSLETLIADKRAHDEVYSLTTSLKKELLKRDLIKVAPREFPDLAAGKRVYEKQCARCHGTDGKGDGPTTENVDMKPPPTDLVDPSYMRKVAPLKVFNTGRLGIEGTRMEAFDHLSDKELWNVAFYVLSLRFQDQDQERALADYERLEDPPSLKELSLRPDEELLKGRPSGMDSSEYLAALRLHQEKASKDAGQEALDTALAYLERATNAYEKGEKDKAKELAITAYLDGIEPIEKRLDTRSPEIVDSLESAMFAVREGIQNGVPSEELASLADEASSSIERASMALEGKGTGYWTVFTITVSIILREGLEAFLIIVAILSVLRSVSAPRAARWVHGGWVLALLIGIGSWFFADFLLDSLGMKRIEVMEGIGALTAVLILLFVGYWLHSKSEISKWKDFVENKVQRLSREENMFGLALLAFIVVFREAFESVIFLSAIRIGAAEGASGAISLASGLTLIVVLLLAYFALRFSQRLPIRSLFRVSSVMLGLLAVILMGKGVHALQESGYLTLTSLPFDLKVGFLGLYPSYESFLAQLLLIAVCFFLWFQGNKPLPSTKT
jgi:high-affinity iron transporter